MANVTYKISGKHDSKGLNDASASLNKLKSVANGVNNIFKGFVVAKVMQGLGTVVQGSTNAFLAQNQALQKFNTATKLSNNSLEKMNNLKAELSNGNFFDDDSLNNAIVMAEQMGLNESQIEDVMTAATDLASSGIMPLDTAVKALGQTYSGTAGSIGKISPEIKNLTKEQLANGEAVELIKEKYGGFAKTLSNTFAGRDTQFKNTFSDLQAAIGGIIQSIKFISQGAFLEPLNKVTNWITANRDNIVAFLYNFPAIAKTVLQDVWKIVQQTFTGDGIQNLFTFLGSTIINTTKNGLQFSWEVIKNLFDDILALGDVTIGNLVRIINNKIMGVGNTIIETVNQALSTILDSKAVKWIAENIFHSQSFDGSNVIQFRFEEKQLTTFNDFVSRINENTANVINKYKATMKEVVAKEKLIFSDFTEDYSDINKTLVANLQNVINNMDIPDDLKQALGNIAEVLPEIAEDLEEQNNNSSSTNPIGAVGSSGDGGVANLLFDLVGEFGEIGSYVKTAMVSGWQGVLVQFIGDVIAMVKEYAPKFNILLNLVSTLLSTVIEEVVPAFEDFAQPFLDGFAALKEIFSSLLGIIGSILLVLSRVFSFCSDILNALAPAVVAILEVVITLIEIIGLIIDCLEPVLDLIVIIIKAIATVITVIGNAINDILIFIYNCVIGIYNLFAKKDKDTKSYTKIENGINKIWKGFDNSEIDELIKSLSTHQNSDFSTSSSSSSGASYTAAKDIYVNIYYDHSYVNGDARQIALNIRDEIRSAEKLGY